MIDRELLELAAKVAELHHPHGFDWITNERGDQWNPLTDDGDALRLVVKLNLGVTVDGYEVEVVTPLLCTFVEKATMGYSIEEATRRAIVRAAAEIGKGMK